MAFGTTYDGNGIQILFNSMILEHYNKKLARRYKCPVGNDKFIIISVIKVTKEKSNKYACKVSFLTVSSHLSNSGQSHSGIIFDVEFEWFGEVIAKICIQRKIRSGIMHGDSWEK
jgi:hypothetical protein